MAEEESLFNYSIGDTSYMAINNGYLTHQPVFSEDLNVTQEVRDACQDDPSCEYDAMAIGDIDIGISTLRTSAMNEDIVQIFS